MKQNLKKVAKKILLIPLYIVMLPFSVVLFLTRILLFPKFFFSLWHKERVEFSSVLGLFAPELLGKLNVISNFKAFLKMKNSDDKEPLSVLLHSWKFYTYDIYYKDNLKYLERVRDNRELFSELLKTDLDKTEIASFYMSSSWKVDKLSKHMLEDREAFKFISNREYRGVFPPRTAIHSNFKPILNFVDQIVYKERSQVILDFLDFHKDAKNPIYRFHTLDQLNDSVFNNYKMRLSLLKDEQFLNGINSISNIKLFRAIFNKERLNGSRSYYSCRFFENELLNIHRLCTDNSLLNTLSTYFDNKNEMAVTVAKTYINNFYWGEKVFINLKRLFTSEGLIESFPTNFNAESSLVRLIGCFVTTEMSTEMFDNFILMLKDLNVIENLKLIDHNHYKLRNSIGDFDFLYDDSMLSFLRKNETKINNLHLLLTNRKFFSKINSLPSKMLAIVLKSCLYRDSDNVNEALALFDCLDDCNNKNVLSKLIIAFETDNYAFEYFLNSLDNYSNRNVLDRLAATLNYMHSKDILHKYCASNDIAKSLKNRNMLDILSDKRFNGTNIREVVRNIDLLAALEESQLIDVDEENKTDCIFDITYIKDCFRAKSMMYRKSDLWKNDKMSKIFQKNAFLFSFFLEYFSNSTIKNTNFEHFIFSKFICSFRDKIYYYFTQLRNFFSQEILLDRLEVLFNEVRSLGASDKLINKVHLLLDHQTNITEFTEGISNVKFMEFFTNGKYQEITQESLNKIQYLKIKDLPKTEKDKSYFQNQGITDEQDLYLLVNLVKESKTVISHIKYSVNLQDNAMYTMHELFDDISIDVDLYNCRKSNNLKQSEPAKLLDLCKISIIKSALVSQVS